MNTLNLLNREPVEYIVCDMRKQELTILNGRSEYKPYNNTLEKTINQAAKLQFNISIKSGVLQYLVNDNLIKYKNDYYIINEVAIDDSDRTVVTISATHECSELNNKQNGKFEEIAKTVEQLVSLVIADTDWVFGTTDIPDSKKRYLLTENESVFTNLVAIAEVFNARLDFNTDSNGRKSIDVYQNPITNGRYIVKGKDLKNVSISYNTDDMVTRLTPFGAVDDSINQPVDIMDINPTHKSYIDNFKYYLNQGYTMDDINKYPMKFIKEKTINNTDCRTSQQLYDWAIEELERVSVPKVSCSVSVADISVLEEFMLKPYSLGETVTIFDTDIDLEIEADINSIQENLDNPFDSTISISNVKEKNSVLKKMVDSANVVDKVIDSNNQIKGTYIAEATIDTAHIKELNAKVIVAESIYGDKIHANTISGKHIISGSITAEDAVFSQGAIGNADISDLSANKLTAGVIDTAEIKIVGTDNVIEIENGQILVNDTSNLALPFNRLIMGKYKLNPEDIEWKYGFVVRGTDGKTVLIDENGVTNAGITDGAIDNNKISVDANIDGSKLNIQTTINALNSYTGSEKLSGVIIEIDGKSLSSKFYEMDNLITEHGELLDKHTSAIEQNANKIKLSVTQQAYYEDKQQFESDLKNVQDSISNIQIGGNNLFIGTKDWSSRVWENVDFDEEYYQGCKVAKVKGVDPNCIKTDLNKHNFKFTIGQTYTISLYAKGKVTGLKLSVAISQAQKSYEPQVVTTDWALYSWTFDSATEDLTRFLIQSENATDTNYISVCRLKVELGNKATDWCPSFDDSSLAIEDVKQQLNDIKADNKLTPNEKQDLLREITAYKAEKVTIDLQCNLYPEISTEQSNFNIAYNSLINYIDPLLDAANMNKTTEINAETFTNYFNEYFNTKTTLLSKLSQASKDRITNAQNTAETAQENAIQAQKDIDKLNNINELTPSKKQELNKEWINIKNSYTANLALANIYNNITTDKNNYTIAYNALNSLLPPLLANLTTTQTIDGVNLTNKLTDFYNKQNILLKKINESSKKIAEDAQYKVENLNIGERNLVLNSNFARGKENWSADLESKIKEENGLKYVSIGYTWECFQAIKLEKGETYTLSLLVRKTTEDNAMFRLAIQGQNQNWNIYISDLNVNWERRSITFRFDQDTNVKNCYFLKQNNDLSNEIEFTEIKLVKGEITTSDWSPAPEDTQSILDDIFADNMITPNEKQSLSREWEEIKSEYMKNKDVATQLKIVAELTDYTTKYNNLKSYMDIILKDMNLTTSINPQEFDTAYNNYINAKVVLLSKISTETKKLADNAQNTANTANQIANENAGALNNMTRDDKLTPVEKLQVDNIMQQIIKEKSSIVTQAQVFAISTTDYVNKYNVLYNYIYGTNGLLTNKNTTSDIIRADFQGYFNNYYVSRQNVLNIIIQKSKEASDKALTDSKKYTDSHVETITKKFSDLGARVEVTENAINEKVWKTDITTETTKVIEKIDNIKIGVRNLLLDSGKPVTTSEYLIKRYNASLIKPSTKYTLVLRGKISEGKKFGVWFNGSATVVSYVETGVNLNTKIVQFTSPSQITHQLVSLYNYPSNVSGEATVEWVAMYEGHIKPPLDWISAPEDTNALIDNIQIGGVNLVYRESKWESVIPSVLQLTKFPEDYKISIEKLTDDSSKHAYVPFTKTLEQGKSYVLSYDIISSIATSGVPYMLALRSNNGTFIQYIDNGNYSKASVWEHREIKFIVNYSQDLTATQLAITSSNMVKGQIISMRNIKIEEGNKATAFSLAPEDVLELKINNGRNIIPNSKSIRVTGVVGVNYKYESRTFLLETILEKGKKYTLSFKVKVLNGTPSKVSVGIANSSVANVNQRHDLTIKDERMSCTFIPTRDDITKVIFYAGLAGSTGNNIVEYQDVMFEKSDIPSKLWTPAPEDIEDKIDNLVIGGTNLLRNSDFSYKEQYKFWHDNTSGISKAIYSDVQSGYDSFVKLTTNHTIPAGLIYDGVFSMSVGEKLTLSLDVNTDDAVKIGIAIDGGTLANGKIFDITDTKKWITLKATFTYTGTNPAVRVYCANTDGVVRNWRFTHIKLERGEYATSWNKHPDDYIAEVNSLQDTMNGAFKDGVLSDAEKKAIKQSYQIIQGDNQEAGNTYTVLNSNPNLIGAAKTNLTTAKTSYNSAYNSLKSFINTALSASIITSSMVSSIDSAFNTYRSALGTFNTRVQEAIDSINSKKVDDIEIGGVNLVLDSKLFSDDNWIGGYTVDGFDGFKARKLVRTDATSGSARAFTYPKKPIPITKYVKGQQYTISGYYYIDSSVPLDGTANNIFVRFSNETSMVADSPLVSLDTTIKDKWVRFEKTDTLKYDGVVSGRFYMALALNGAILMCMPKFELGNKATDWSPAPEDVENNINNLESTMNGSFKDGLLSESEKKAIKQSLNIVLGDGEEVQKQYDTVYNNSNLTGTPKSNLLTAKTSYNNAYSSLNSFINSALNASQVTSTMVDSINSAFATYRSTLGVFNQRLQEAIDSINSKKVDDIEVGGRNLILYSEDFKLTGNTRVFTFTNDIVDTLNASIGKSVILSVNLELTNCTGNDSAGRRRVGAEVAIKYEDGTYTYVQCWKYPSVGDSINNTRISGKPYVITKKVIQVTGGLYNQAKSEKITISKAKLEIGTKSTDWSPAPEDTINNLEIGGVNLFVKKTATKNKYLNSSGQAIDETHWFYTDYIDVEGMKNIIASGYVNLGDAPSTCFYDSNKKFVSSVRNKMQELSKLLTIPEGISYIRYSCDIRGFDTLKLEQGTKVTAYSPSPQDVTNEIELVTTTTTNKFSEVNKSISEISNKVSTSESTIKEINKDIASKETRLKEVETKVTDSNFAIQVQKNQNKIYRFRYIRDYANGSTVNTGNHWIEIQAINNLGVNVAKGKVVSGSGLTNGTLVTDGNTSGSYASGGKYVQIDLGAIYEDIDCLKIWHYYSDSRTYHGTKTQISIDGVNWTTVFDSAVSGEYKESKYGHTIKLNDNSIHTMLADFDEEGLAIKNGALKIQNNKGENVLVGDTDGNLDYKGNLTQSLPDGSELVISAKDGFYNKIGTNKNEYHHLTYSGKINVETKGGTENRVIQIPEEFQGKKFNVLLNFESISFSGVPTENTLENQFLVCNIAKDNKSFTITYKIETRWKNEYGSISHKSSGHIITISYLMLA